jgi:hypothetical protein
MLAHRSSMQIVRAPARPVNQPWIDQVFFAKAVNRAGVVRRAVRDVEREVGRDAFIHEVRRRGFHLVECGGQFIVICNSGQMKILV